MILIVAQIDPLRVGVLLPVQAFGKMRAGRVGEVTAEGFSERHAARVKLVDRVLDAASGTFSLRLELPNPGCKLPGGVCCQVEFAQRDKSSRLDDQAAKTSVKICLGVRAGLLCLCGLWRSESRFDAEPRKAERKVKLWLKLEEQGIDREEFGMQGGLACGDVTVR